MLKHLAIGLLFWITCSAVNWDSDVEWNHFNGGKKFVLGVPDEVDDNLLAADVSMVFPGQENVWCLASSTDDSIKGFFDNMACHDSDIWVTMQYKDKSRRGVCFCNIGKLATDFTPFWSILALVSSIWFRSRIASWFFAEFRNAQKDFDKNTLALENYEDEQVVRQRGRPRKN